MRCKKNIKIKYLKHFNQKVNTAKRLTSEKKRHKLMQDYVKYTEIR